MIVTTKLITILLSLALTAFTVSTIVLAVQKSNLKDELNDAKRKLDLLENNTTTTTTTTTTTETPTETPIETTTETTTEEPIEPINYRLPDTIVPTHYDLYLHPDIQTGNFTGQEDIQIYVEKATDKIILHAHNLIIKYVYFKKTDSPLEVEKYYLESKRQFLIIELNEELKAKDTYTLSILFEGTMHGKIVGLYMSSYLKEDKDRYIATSKFEPTYARQAFPCFDEPAMKATFTITLVYPNNDDYHALSNMNMLNDENQDKYVERYFNKSVPMSTYLACFIISDFAHKSKNIDTKGIGEPFEMRAFATAEQIEKIKFALEVGKAVIEYYIQYFKIAYPLPKLDMIAIPDFVSGAMEHWGLVTYRETALLFDENESSAANKQRIASVIAHEFAHMWFGNLVTMKWWNDLWLNEGFARYIENKGVESYLPDWKMQEQFLVGTLHDILNLDATLGSHPIVQEVETPDQITEIFDSITYSKGASIIRMLENFVGSEIFENAVQNYLNKHAYKNAVTDDFLTEVDNLVNDYDVKQIMRTWTEQMGFPVLNVEIISQKQYKITQKRFFSNPDDYDEEYDESHFNYTWSVPIKYKTNLESEAKLAVFYHDTKEVIIELPEEVDWIKINAEQVGFYRVNYNDDLWKKLADKLIENHESFTIGDRVGLLNDAFALADATQLSYDFSLDMTKYLKKEEDYVPWSFAAGKLTSINRKLLFTKSFVLFRAYANSLIEPIYKKYDWVSQYDQHLENRMRVTAFSAACSLGITDCLSKASSSFKEWLEQPTTRPLPDLREIVYYYGLAESGNQEIWDKVWNLYLKETDANEKAKLIFALSGIKDPWILSRFIAYAWDENNVRSQDYFTCIQNIAANPIGEPLVWDYVRENWTTLTERFGLNERYLGNMIPSITSQFSTQTKYEEMISFFEKNPDAGAGAAARVRALENVKNNIAWLENNSENINDWLNKPK